MMMTPENYRRRRANDPPEWSSVLYERRRELKLKQTDIEKRTDGFIKQVSVSEMENGRLNPTAMSTERFFAYIAALDWTTSEFAAATGLELPLYANPPNLDAPGNAQNFTSRVDSHGIITNVVLRGVGLMGDDVQILVPSFMLDGHTEVVGVLLQRSPRYSREDAPGTTLVDAGIRETYPKPHIIIFALGGEPEQGEPVLYTLEGEPETSIVVTHMDEPRSVPVFDYAAQCVKVFDPNAANVRYRGAILSHYGFIKG